MPLAGTEQILAAQMFTMVQAELGLSSVNPPPSPQTLIQLQKLCTGLANAIVPHIVSMAQVAPGIPTSGSPAAQVTVAPGVLM